MEENSSQLPKDCNLRTKEIATGWVCTVEFSGRVVALNGLTERAAIERAAMHVAAVGECFTEQSSKY